jgi:hypothetical protein
LLPVFDHEVRRLEVEVDDAGVVGVQEVAARRGVLCHRHPRPPRQCAVLVAVQDGVQAAAVAELRDNAEPRRPDDGAHEQHDVRVAQLLEQRHLVPEVLEQRRGLRAEGLVLEHALDRDVAAAPLAVEDLAERAGACRGEGDPCLNNPCNAPH